MTNAVTPLLVITPTVERPGRMAFLERCLSSFRGAAGLHWIVVEDGAASHPEVIALLARGGVAHTCLAQGPSHAWGNAQRDAGLRHVRDLGMTGIVYLADDDNFYEPALFAELRQVRRVGVLPVGLLGPRGIERPIVRGGRIAGWSAHWKSRRYPLDMAGFAFNAGLLQKFTGPIWTFETRGGETEFLERLIASPDELEILCDGCRRCHVWHNLPLGVTPRRALAAYHWRRTKDLVAGRLLRSRRQGGTARQAP